MMDQFCFGISLATIFGGNFGIGRPVFILISTMTLETTVLACQTFRGINIYGSESISREGQYHGCAYNAEQLFIKGLVFHFYLQNLMTVFSDLILIPQIQQ